MDFLSAGFERLPLGRQSRAKRQEDDDADSMISISTMATIDNQPGTGRSLDTYVFQPLGRRIERLAMRLTIASLHPARIALYIETDWSDFHPYYHHHHSSIDDVIALVCTSFPNGSTVVAGMKGLVKQTQYVAHPSS